MASRVLARLLVATLLASLAAPAATYALDPSTSTVLSSASSALAGAPVTYTATVNAPAGSPVPTGTVTVRDGAAPIGACTLAAGSCVVTTTSLSVGTHAITAAYGGDAAHDPSTSVVALQTITMGVRAARTAATTASSGQTSLVVNAPVGATTGDALIAAVTVTGGTGVTITAAGWTRLAGSDVSSGTLLRQGLFYRSRTTGDPSTFTFGFSTAQKASAIIVAVAGGNGATPRSAGAAYASATSFTLPTVAFGGTASGVALGFLGVGVGTTIGALANGYTSTASIAATGGKAATQTTSGAGQLTLTDATSAIGARFTTGAAAVGIGHTVFVQRAAAATVTRILSGPSAATFGTAATYSVRVDPTTATGSVAFVVDGAATAGSCGLVAGVCSANLSLPAGQRTVTARYSPIPTTLLASASSPVTVSVARAASATTLTGPGAATTRGSVASFRIAVSGGLSATSGTGVVRLLEDTVEVGRCTLAAGACDATTATLTVGTHVLTAAFDGDTNLEPSTSATWTHAVTRVASSTTLLVSPTSTTYGASVTFGATVTSAGGTPTGTVSFSDGGVAIASCILGATGSPGACSASVTTLSVGSHPITASYEGDVDRLSSGTASQTVTVGKASSTLSVTSLPASATFGSALTIRASVTTGDGSPATGTITFTEGIVVLGTCTLGTPTTGTCSISTSTLTVGDHLIGVAYGGDAVHAAARTSYTQSIGRAASTTAVSSSLTPSTYGSGVTFTVTVTSGAGTPTGSIAVSDGTTPIGSCPLVGGTCTVATSSLAAGDHAVVATYGGDANRSSSTASVSQRVNRATTATTLSVGGTLTYGSPVTLTASVDRTAATGTVAFSDGGVAIGSCTLGSGGIAGRCTLTTSALAAGTRSLTAAYAGDANHAPSTSLAATPSIARVATNLSLARSGGTTYGSTMVLTATLDRTAATGTISFSDGTTGIGTCTVGALAPGSCSLSIATLAVGDHAVSARYAGDANHQGTVSSTVVATVAPGASTTTIAASVSSAVVAEQVTLTATVTPAGATGTVEFRDGSEAIGQCTVAAGTCSAGVSFASKGGKSILAAYLGDSNLAGSTSGAIAIVVRAPSTTALATDLTSSTYGGAVTMTASVAGADGGTPTGRVAFSDGTLALGACDLAASASVAATAECSITVSSLRAGARSLVARYGGDVDYGTSAGTAAVTVVEATSATTVTTSAASAVAGTPVTFTVAVTTADGSVGVGTVAVSDGTTAVGSCVLSAAASCTVTTSTLAIGARTIVATFLGDPNHTGSSGSLVQTITAIPTTVSATPNPASTSFGSPVTITATVSPSAATGSVTFVEGGTTYGSCSILAATPGTCSFTTSALAVGTRTITVRYGGDSRYAASSTTTSVTVAKASSTTTIATSASTGTYGSSITFTATVSPTAATGTVGFSDGTTGIGTCTLAVGSNGVCSITVTTLSVGAHSITARFAGSTSVNPSTSAAIAQTILVAPTTLALTSSANPSTAGAGTVTVTVSPAAATGVVTVTDNGAAVGSCALASGTCQVSIAGLSLGGHSLLASYPGSATHGPSSAGLLQTVSIGYRTVANANSGSQTVTSLGLTIPASVTTGDVLVVAVSAGSGSVTIGAPGWTRLGADVTSGALTQALLWRVATTGDAGVTTSFGFSTAVKASAVLVAVGGASTTAPAAGTYATQVNAGATQIATPSLVAPASTRGIALIFGGMATGTTISSVGSGFTFPAGGESASSGGKGQTTTAGAYSIAGTFGTIAANQFATASSTAATSVGSIVFLAQGATP